MTKKVYTGRTMLATRRVNTLPGYELVDPRYEVWNDGTIIGKRGVPIGTVNRGNGYYQTRILEEKANGRGKDVYHHRLVALAFIENTENKPQVNHIDENKENNHISNLEWATAAENANHGTRNERSAKSLSIPVIGTHIKTGEKIYFPSAREAERVGGFDNGAIGKVARGIWPHYKGYIWEQVAEKRGLLHDGGEDDQ